MGKADDGGMAFPSGEEYEVLGAVGTKKCAKAPMHKGMTLRDYFAAKAMQGMIVNCFKNGGKEIAIAAYGMADYMLEERKK